MMQFAGISYQPDNVPPAKRTTNGWPAAGGGSRQHNIGVIIGGCQVEISVRVGGLLHSNHVQEVEKPLLEEAGAVLATVSSSNMTSVLSEVLLQAIIALNDDDPLVASFKTSLVSAAEGEEDETVKSTGELVGIMQV